MGDTPPFRVCICQIFFVYLYVKNDYIDIRRNKEDSLHQQVSNGLVIRRRPLKKQKAFKKKVKYSKADYTFLQFHHIIFKWAINNYSLTNRELNILLYLYPLITFTFREFTQALKELGSRDDTTFTRFKKRGWIVLWSKTEDGAHYCLSNKANTLVARLHRMFMSEEEIPMSPRRNVLVKETETNQDLIDLFKKFNNIVKEKNERKQARKNI